MIRSFDVDTPARHWYLKGAEASNADVPGGYKWWLMCNECAFRLPDGAAAAPWCPDCGSPLHIHSNAAPYTIVWPLDAFNG